MGNILIGSESHIAKRIHELEADIHVIQEMGASNIYTQEDIERAIAAIRAQITFLQSELEQERNPV